MKSVAREVIETILLAALVFLLIQLTFQNFRVKGASMDPNLREGEHLLVNKLAYLHIDPAWLNSMFPFLNIDPRSPVYLFGLPQDGDVIVFRFPRDPSRDFIKRVIAGPGETVEMRSGKVFVNGQPLDEPYIYERDRFSMPPVRVPPDSFFVMGDNRPGSNDSRDWGPVPRQYIVGKAWVSYWPVNAWGFVPNYSYARPNN
ncbi:MAG: signal peptidase I [Chloroflexi bacterium]|nr:signal peptidase I [Chloroflexota bacterium]